MPHGGGKDNTKTATTAAAAKVYDVEDSEDSESDDSAQLEEQPLSPTIATTSPTTFAFELAAWYRFVQQLIQQPPFVHYVSLNFMMNFNYFLSDSFLVFLDQKLMSKVMPPWYRLIVTTLALYLPKFGVQIMTPYANANGLHRLITRVIQGSIAVGVVALLVGRRFYFVWGLLVVMQRFLLSSWGFYDLIISDVIDNDRVLHQRRQSVATSVHGVQSLFVKPAQSLAPMAGIFILSATMGSSSGSSSSGESDVGMEYHRDGVYLLTFGLPLLCSIVQWFVWSKFTLKGEKLKKIKEQVVLLL